MVLPLGWFLTGIVLIASHSPLTRIIVVLPITGTIAVEVSKIGHSPLTRIIVVLPQYDDVKMLAEQMVTVP